MTLNPDDLAEAMTAMVAEVGAVDACVPEWASADQSRYVRLLLEDGVDEMARADDAWYDYMADCVMLAGQNMQDARLQIVEDRLQAQENPPPPKVKDFVLDTAIMLGFELLVVTGAEILIPSLIVMAAARVQARATRQLTAISTQAVADLDALAPPVSDAITKELTAADARRQASLSPSASTYRDERVANRERRTAWLKLQVGRAALETSEAVFRKAHYAAHRSILATTVTATRRRIERDATHVPVL